jgi:tRNA threonylcarbamoyladenosine biosynthesis protein TsaE
MKIVKTSSAEETIKLGEELGKKLKGGDVVCLTGDLGGGKTQFTKGIAKGLNINEPIISPTFVIMRNYYRENLPNFYHLDLYRINSVKDVEELDLDELIGNINSIVIIEWPERAKELIPENAIWIEFAYIGENEREIKISGKEELF